MEIMFNIPSRFDYVLNVHRSVAICDGDTIVATITMRVYGIDAPEYGQKLFDKSRVKLDCLLHKKAEAVVKGVDPYGRLLVIITSCSKDVGKELVLAGLAWSVNGVYCEEEQIAKLKKRGIWRFKGPVLPPWEYRKTTEFKKGLEIQRKLNGNCTSSARQD